MPFQPLVEGGATNARRKQALELVVDLLLRHPEGCLGPGGHRREAAQGIVPLRIEGVVEIKRDGAQFPHTGLR